MASSPVVEYRRTFDFAVPPAELWRTIEHHESYEEWWPYLRELTVDGGLSTGSVLRGVVRPPVPYRMRLEIVLERCRRPSLIDARVHGDLEGEAHLRFRREGEGTRAEASWTVEMMQPAMRLANLLARPLLLKAHDVVVDLTVASFRRQLRDVREGV